MNTVYSSGTIILAALRKHFALCEYASLFDHEGRARVTLIFPTATDRNAAWGTLENFDSVCGFEILELLASPAVGRGGGFTFPLQVFLSQLPFKPRDLS